MVHKVALSEPASTALMLQDSPSPSSGDAIDVSADALASRRKRPLESSDGSKPPLKRERKESDPPVHDLARAAWDALKKKEPERPDFRKDELVAMFVEECQRLRLSTRATQRLKRQLGKFVCRVGMFQKSSRQDAPQDSFVMVNPDYKHVRSREAQKKGDGGKKGESGSGGSNGGDDVVMQEVPNRATVPSEWTTEAYKPVRLSTFDKSHAIRFVGGNMVKGLKGYRMIRGSNGVSEGDWYFECTIMPYQEGAVRLGWSMRRCDVETPVGFDPHGFGLRDRSGEFVHMARRKPYGEPFGQGDVIGCRIVLPTLTEEDKKAVADAEERLLQYRFVSYGQGPAPADSGIDITWRAKIEFFKNGKSMGIPSLFNAPKPPLAKPADEESTPGIPNGHAKSKESVIPPPQTEGEVKKCMKAGVYYPSIALFQNAVVQANFGPNFKHDLPEGSRPMCDAAREKPVDPAPVETPAVTPQKTEEGGGGSLESPKPPVDEPKQCGEETIKPDANSNTIEIREESEESRMQGAGDGGQPQKVAELTSEQQSQPVQDTEQPDGNLLATENVHRGTNDITNSGSGADGAAVDKMPVSVS